MLVSFQSQVQHLTGLIALLSHQLIADGEKPRKTSLDDLIEMDATLALRGTESPGATHGEEALQAGQDGARVVGIEKLHGIIHEVGPLVGEIEVQNPLKNGNYLLTDQACGGGHDGE